MDDFDAKLVADARARAKAAEAEAAKLRARVAEREHGSRRLQQENDKPTDAPAVPDAEQDA